MDDICKLIQSLASVLWPVLVLVFAWYFRSSIAQVIESAKGRKFTVKVGGQELSMDEASDQQEKAITDLRNQLTALQRHLNLKAEDLANQMPYAAERTPASQAVLWVDDHPKNNSYLISSILGTGYQVDLATSTGEALKKLSKASYRVIISDMGREENGEYRAEAGLELLTQLRASGDPTPFVVYCSSHGARKYKEAVVAKGGLSATASSLVLFSLIKEYLPDHEA